MVSGGLALPLEMRDTSRIEHRDRSVVSLTVVEERKLDAT